jgi:hypothetical protein
MGAMFYHLGGQKTMGEGSLIVLLLAERARVGLSSSFG